ncbi:hypothetical protein [Caldivirga sp.]|uniref:hypothetical protein n=1 Tax=Caldivirga sp. TaxID=2080243 RepID=UPI0025BD08BE|nr:hypothetical protein [Caldivirga sp.]
MLLPNSFTVAGPYAKLLYAMLGLPINSTLSPIMLTNRPSVRLAWHVDYLTVILRNGSRIFIEARTQEIQIKANGIWLTITPNNIKPKYEIKVIKGNETLKALMSVVRSVRVYRPIYPPPSKIMSIINGFRVMCRLHGVVCSPPLPIVEWLKATHRWLMFTYVYLGFDSTPTWALSAFINLNSTYSICGYVYPGNGSDLVVPVNDYAGILLSLQFNSLN